jgi:hypothetical protein
MKLASCNGHHHHSPGTCVPFFEGRCHGWPKSAGYSDSGLGVFGCVGVISVRSSPPQIQRVPVPLKLWLEL